jgi:hypothetical protein
VSGAPNRLLLDRQAREIPELDDLCLPRADARQLIERLVEREQFDGSIDAGADLGVERCPRRAAAAFVGRERARVIDEDPPHHLSGEGVELLAVVELQFVLPDQSEPRFVQNSPAVCACSGEGAFSCVSGSTPDARKR